MLVASATVTNLACSADPDALEEALVILVLWHLFTKYETDVKERARRTPTKPGLPRRAETLGTTPAPGHSETPPVNNRSTDSFRSQIQTQTQIKPKSHKECYVYDSVTKPHKPTCLARSTQHTPHNL